MKKVLSLVGVDNAWSGVLIIRFHYAAMFSQEWVDKLLNTLRIPEGELAMGFQVFQGNGVCSHHHWQPVVTFNKLLELRDRGTGRIAHHQTCCQMYHVATIFQEFCRNMFYVSARTTATVCIANDLHLFVRAVKGKTAMTLAQRPEKFAATAILVTGTDDNSYFFHFGPFPRENV